MEDRLFIYSVKNKKTGRIYIGETANPARRFYQHFYTLENRISHHPLLQSEYNKHGPEEFECEILECATDERAEFLQINNIPNNLSLNVQKRDKTGNAKNANNRLKQLRKSFYSGDS